MKYHITLFCIWLCSVIVPLHSQSRDSVITINTAFKSDEKLYYKVRYGLIKGGDASLTIHTVPVGDTYMFHIKAIAQTTGVVGAMVTITDIYESYVDIASGFPVKSVRNIREHKYTSYNEVLYFRDQGFLRSLNSGDHKASDDILDVLSAFYYARRYLFSNKLEKDQIITLNTYFDDQFFPLKVKFKQREKIKTKFGKISSLRFVPIINDKTVFKNEEQLQIWVTDDNNFIPVKIRVKLPIGSLKCDIDDFEGIKNEHGQLQK